MSSEPTPSQVLLLFGLLARHGECPQAELMPAVKKADREALIKSKLATAEKRGRGLYLTLTDAGWAWTGTHLSAELPPAHRALSDLMNRLHDYLLRSGQTLADLIGSKPAMTGDTPLSTKPPPKPRGPKATARKVSRPKTLTPAALRKRIETAYLAITGQKRARSVKLSRLRAELADLDRATVDGALGRILAGDKKASLMRHDDPAQLDRGDHEAAFSPAGEPFHLIWIAS
jgi:hypothetical protein